MAILLRNEYKPETHGSLDDIRLYIRDDVYPMHRFQDPEVMGNRITGIHASDLWRGLTDYRMGIYGSRPTTSRVSDQIKIGGHLWKLAKKRIHTSGFINYNNIAASMSVELLGSGRSVVITEGAMLDCYVMIGFYDNTNADYDDPGDFFSKCTMCYDERFYHSDLLLGPKMCKTIVNFLENAIYEPVENNEVYIN